MSETWRFLGFDEWTTSFKNEKPDDLADGETLSELIVLGFKGSFFKSDLAKLSGKIAGRRLKVKIELSVMDA